MSTRSTGAGASWGVFATTAPRLSAQVRTIFEHGGQAYGYLATVHHDGGPRLHPVNPVITSDGLFCLVPTPVMAVAGDIAAGVDLRRDGRYALHAGRARAEDDQAFLAGWAMPAHRSRQVTSRGARGDTHSDGQLFELTIAVAIVTRRDPADGRASHAVWRPQ